MKVVGFAGFSGAGKTTLIEQVIAAFRARGLRVSVIKHAHHRFDIDRPGKDSYRHREAGAFEVLIASRSQASCSKKAVQSPHCFQVRHSCRQLWPPVNNSPAHGLVASQPDMASGAGRLPAVYHSCGRA